VLEIVPADNRNGAERLQILQVLQILLFPGHPTPQQ
jgi:hypothetical protein